MRASDIMTRGVVTVRRDAPVLEAVRLMLRNRISGLPVVDDTGGLVGMVTEGDFLRRAETGTERTRPRWLAFFASPGKLAEEYAHAHGRRVDEVMTTKPLSVFADMPIEAVVREMEKRRVKRVPVIEGGKLVGIISRADLVRTLATVAAVLPPAAKDDTGIRERLLTELHGKSWCPTILNIAVANGIVDLSGVLGDERARKAVKIAAENVPGVKEVHDHLVWVDPESSLVFLSDEDKAARPLTAD